MGDHGDFIGAVRMPFYDIVIVQRRDKGVAPRHAAEFVATRETSDGYLVNEYFIENSHLVLDSHNEADIAEKLDELPQFVYTPTTEQGQKAEPKEVMGVKHGQYVVRKRNGKETILRREGDKLVPVKPANSNPAVRERITRLVRIGEAARRVLDVTNDGADDATLKKAQQHLHEVYDLSLIHI